MIFHDQSKLNISEEFLLSPQAEPVRKVAESLYPFYLAELVKNKKKLVPSAMPVLDVKFMTSPEGRWARILAETTYADFVLAKEKVAHTVIFFGSARITEKKNKKVAHDLSRYYTECRLLSEKITRWSLEQGSDDVPQPVVVATGGGPSIMEAGNRGAADAGGKTIGFNITLPMEQSPNPYISGTLNFDFHYFFTRKFHFSYLAKSLVAFPGGFGTFDELFEILTLIQTGKISKKMSITLYGKDFWEKTINFKHLVETGVISASDLDLFNITDDVDEAFEVITNHLQSYLTV